MLYIKPTSNSPKIVVDFSSLLFEVSGISKLENALEFYQPVFDYINDNFFQIKDSIYQRNTVSITLHFYIKYAGIQDILMLRQIDWLFSRCKEFTTYIYWYYNPYKTDSIELANDINHTFLNNVRLIEHSLNL